MIYNNINLKNYIIIFILYSILMDYPYAEYNREDFTQLNETCNKNYTYKNGICWSDVNT